jgi:Uncharacterized conserved protein
MCLRATFPCRRPRIRATASCAPTPRVAALPMWRRPRPMASRSRSIRCRPRRSRRRPSSSTSLTSSTTIRFRTTCASSSSLHRMIQIEPWLDRDRAMIDLLKSIGIEKGKPFTPDECTKAILTDAAVRRPPLPRCALRGSLRATVRCQRTLGVAGVERLAAALQTNFADPNSYPTDARGLAYSYAYFSAKHLGEGQFYLMTIKDKDGNRIDGAKTYRLHVPPNPPVRLYWSATVYDRATHALIRDMKWSSRSSNTPGCKRTTTGRATCISGPGRPRGRNRTGYRQMPAASGSVVSPLRTRAGVLRKEMDIAGHRESRETLADRRSAVQTSFGSLNGRSRTLSAPFQQATPSRRS